MNDKMHPSKEKNAFDFPALAGGALSAQCNAMRATEFSALKQIRHHIEISSARAQLVALAPDVLARTKAIEEMLSPSKTAAKYFQELNDGWLLNSAAEQASKLADVHLNAVRVPEFSAREQIRHHVEISSVVAQLAALAPDVLARTKAIEEMLSPSKAAAKYLQELSNGRALKLATEQALRWNAPYKELAGALARFNEPLSVSSTRGLLESMAKASELFEVGRLLEDVAQLPESEEVREGVVHLMQGVTEGISEVLTRQEAVDLIVHAIQANKEPLQQKLLFIVLMPVLIAIIFAVVNPVADFYVKKWLEGAPKQEATKQVKEAAREVVGDVRLLNDFRFVSTQNLALMSGPKAKAPVLARLQFGQVVRVLEKVRDFTLVVWRSEDGKVELQGWVFSRYLKRFN